MGGLPSSSSSWSLLLALATPGRLLEIGAHFVTSFESEVHLCKLKPCLPSLPAPSRPPVPTREPQFTRPVGTFLAAGKHCMQVPAKILVAALPPSFPSLKQRLLLALPLVPPLITSLENFLIPTPPHPLTRFSLEFNSRTLSSPTPSFVPQSHIS
ncbi:hypothetical protein BHE90_014729 [Fusarium euwallaceae]|uniref:Uncharacterized protein n=3 Tax=Fusarium solani species complex TaxID=232080 RepID=A0A3M2S463_9HYPO|nr:hypothetical protein CDV36_008284 [Fusarium kuroshium]RSL57947.1 hypothetical protein CEP51_014153 [Fusarium floridanum]RTE70866.1 hypothetical protein BHE90_014729 [Fusarium euwallaceae]